MIDLPARPGFGPNAMAEFNAISRTLIDEWERRKKLRGQLPPAESANGYLKRESYRIIVHYISHERTRFFEGVIRRDGRGLTARVKLEENPFHFGLLALFADDSVVSKQDRSLFAMQMLYAYHHAIPPAFLIGFIYQAGSKEVIKRKLSDGYVELGFEGTHKRSIRDVKIGSLR